MTQGKSINTPFGKNTKPVKSTFHPKTRFVTGNSIKKAINTILNIGGFIVIFSVIISILEESNFFFIISYILDMYGWNGEFFIGILKGILELTNGVKTVSLQGNLHLNIGIIHLLSTLTVFSIHLMSQI